MKAVLDTNVWLDCLVFADTASAPLDAACRSGRIVVLHTSAMRDEWLDVVRRARFALDERRQCDAALAFDRISRLRPTAPSCPLSCRDPFDQMFVDLAISERADWLVTKDKALLALARRALRDYGLSIVRPDAPQLLARLDAARTTIGAAGTSSL